MSFYGIIVWEASDRIVTVYAQIKILARPSDERAVVGAHFRDSVNPYYIKLKIRLIDDFPSLRSPNLLLLNQQNSKLISQLFL